MPKTWNESDRWFVAGAIRSAITVWEAAITDIEAAALPPEAKTQLTRCFTDQIAKGKRIASELEDC